MRCTTLTGEPPAPQALIMGPELAGPVAVGRAGRVAPSRVLFGPHVTNLGRRRALSERHVAYYARRAAGGVGVIVTEVASVHDSDWPYERAPLAVDCSAGWREVAAACRPFRTLVVAGLGHAGSQGSSAYGQQALWAPSRVPDVGSREVPMEMEQPEIDALVAGFAAAAALAVEAGLDGVEIDAGQHALLRQFRSGLTNRRADGYRADGDRLLCEVLVAVREAVGDGLVGLRLGADELAPWAGITPAAALSTAAVVAGWIDYLVPVRGCALSEGATRPDLHAPPGFNRELCAAFAAAPGRPDTVVLQGSVVDPAMAQAALDDGVADLVEMTRAQITDPDLVALVRAGAPGRIRPCTLSNQRSTVRDPRNFIVSDDAEPGAGYETADLLIDAPIARAAAVAGPAPGASIGRSRALGPSPREVLVVGGGPAGLEAARVLALRGHPVRLVEQAGVLGGALLRAAAVGGRARLGLLVPWWERELTRLGVTVETGRRVSLADLDVAVDHGAGVVLATGSRNGPRPYACDGPMWSAADFEAVVLAAGSTEAALADLPPGPVVVHDPLGDWTGVGVAEQLAAAGRTTVIVTGDQVVGTQLSTTGDLAPANARLERAGVCRELRSVLRGVAAGRATLEHVWTGERRQVDCVAVIDCGHRSPDDALWRSRPALTRAGDCVAPRTVYEAVLEGRRAAVSCSTVAAWSR